MKPAGIGATPMVLQTEGRRKPQACIMCLAAENRGVAKVVSQAQL